MVLTAAKAFGSTKIVVTDVNSHNLALADQMGATKTYLQQQPATPQEVANKLKEMLGPVGPQIVFDCVGLESTVQTAVLSCCERGRVVIVGMAQEYVSVPMNMLAAREVEMVGTQRYANTVSIILDYYCHYTCIQLDPYVPFTTCFCIARCTVSIHTCVHEQTKSIVSFIDMSGPWTAECVHRDTSMHRRRLSLQSLRASRVSSARST